jgi:hypothetical protein
MAIFASAVGSPCSRTMNGPRQEIPTRFIFTPCIHVIAACAASGMIADNTESIQKSGPAILRSYLLRCIEEPKAFTATALLALKGYRYIYPCDGYRKQRDAAL